MDAGNRTFTWKELSKLNGRQNAHVAVRGKVAYRQPMTDKSLVFFLPTVILCAVGV